ncbi:MAG: xylulokinase [Caldicoprobacterales bacterium]|jgi:sugar (pentulose or hexulose) kinase|nr:hypothetical protein [Clostridiales bacterium]
MYVLGIDIGTTCTKAIVLSRNGEVVSTGSHGYRLITKDSHVEQRAEDWTEAAVQAVCQALKGVDGHQVEAISLSTQGASSVAMDKDWNTVGNALTWMDRRAVAEAKELEDKLTADYIYKTTGWTPNATLDAAKIMYMKKQPEYANAVRFISTLEFANLFLTGNAVVDPTNAAIRQMYHVENGCWDEKILEASGIREEELTPVLPTGARVGELTDKAAKLMGLPAGIPVFNGAHDQYCAAIGAGAVNEGDMLLSAGTTWVLLGITTKPMFTKSHIAAGKHPVSGLYGALASLVTSGASLQWFKNEFVSEGFKEIDEEAAKRRDPDLFFYPYLTGAPFPIQRPNAKGAFTGITLSHDRFDFARAIMEGVVFGVKRGLENFAENGSPVKQLMILGGAAKSVVWSEMIADVTGIPIVRLNQADICAVGAGMIAALGAGWFDSYESAAKAITKVDYLYHPNEANQEYYTRKYAQFRRMWDFMQQYYEENA